MQNILKMNIQQKAFMILVLSVSLSIVIAKYDIYVRGIHCKHFDPEFLILHRCEVKAERGRKGVIYGRATVIKPLDKIWMHVQLFWRGSSSRFQPYLVDMDLGLYASNENPGHLHTLNPLLKVIRSCTASILNVEFMTAIKRGCPIMANVNISSFEADKQLKSYLPPVIPEGTFKLSLRIHSASNRTIADVAVIHEIKTLGISDYIKLG